MMPMKAMTPFGNIGENPIEGISKEVAKQSVFGFFPNPKEFLEKMRDKVSASVSEKSAEYLEPTPYGSVLDIPCRLLDEPSSAEAKRIGDQAVGKKAILFVNVASK